MNTLKLSMNLRCRENLSIWLVEFGDTCSKFGISQLVKLGVRYQEKLITSPTWEITTKPKKPVLLILR